VRSPGDDEQKLSGDTVAPIYLSQRLLFAALVLAGGCVAGPTDPDPSDNPLKATVRTTDAFRFVSAEVHIGVGGVVEWRSDSSLRHSVTPVGHDLWQSVETEDRGAIMLTVTFTSPGVYDYRCEYHWQDNMVGRVIVLE
jgi:plastocyanin